MDTIKKLAIGGVVLAVALVLVVWSLHTKRNTEADKERSLQTAGLPVPVDDSTMEYRNPTYHFSLRYPKELGELVVRGEDADRGRTIVISNADKSKTLQIYIVPYSGSQISKERFEADEPSGVMQDPKAVFVDGTPATMFFGNIEGAGDTREVWFIRGGYLYEVATYKSLDSWLSQIMATWKFI